MSLDKIKIQATTKSFIEHFDPEAKIEIMEKDRGCAINIETEMSGLLIGRGGENLDALQHLLRLILVSEAGEFFPVLVDVSGYRALREKDLMAEAKTIAEKVLETGELIELEPMSSYERRLVHLALQDIEGIETDSMGVGAERRVVIKKSTK